MCTHAGRRSREWVWEEGMEVMRLGGRSESKDVLRSHGNKQTNKDEVNNSRWRITATTAKGISRSIVHKIGHITKFKRRIHVLT